MNWFKCLLLSIFSLMLHNSYAINTTESYLQSNPNQNNEKVNDMKGERKSYQYKIPKIKEDKKKKKKLENPIVPKSISTKSGWMDYIIYLIVILILIIVLIYLSKYGFFNSQKVERTKIEYYENIEDINSINVTSDLEKAIQSEAFAWAIRLYFLDYLKTLNIKNLIYWKKEKTNRIYATELTNTVHFDSFITLSELYEYVWYGNVSVSKHDFQKTESQFKTQIYILKNPKV